MFLICKNFLTLNGCFCSTRRKKYTLKRLCFAMDSSIFYQLFSLGNLAWPVAPFHEHWACHMGTINSKQFLIFFLFYFFYFFICKHNRGWHWNSYKGLLMPSLPGKHHSNKKFGWLRKKKLLCLELRSSA